MYRFLICYEDKGYVDYKNVMEACYIGQHGYSTVCGDDIIGHHFPVGKTLRLRADSGSCTVNGTGIRSITIEKQ